MPKAFSVSELPAFVRGEFYDFATTDDTFSVYQELTAFAEEIEQSRARNISNAHSSQKTLLSSAWPSQSVFVPIFFGSSQMRME